MTELNYCYSVDPFYLLNRTDINNDTRRSFIDWIFDVGNKFSFHIQTIHLAVMLFDKYISESIIDQNEINYIPAVCLYLAVKFEEIELIEFKNLKKEFHRKFGIRYSKKKFLKIEPKVLRKLGYQLIYETPYQIIKSDSIDLDTKDYYLALFLCSNMFISTDYLLLSTKELSKAIIEFVINLKKIDTFKEHINSYSIYALIYLNWIESYEKQTNFRSVYQYFGNEIYLHIANEIPPKIDIVHDMAIITMTLNMEYKQRSNGTKNNSPNNSLKSIETDELQSIDVFNKLGSGTYGSVHRAKLGETYVALKKNYLWDDGEGIDEVSLREINMFLALKHKNIINLIGFHYDPKIFCMTMALELMDKSLGDVKPSHLTKETKLSFTIQLLEGISYMHSRNIVHRDLSMANILVTKNTLKIADLGSARYYAEHSYINYSEVVCTIHTRAIEILLGKQPYTNKIDVWSAACIIGYLFNNDYLYYGDYETDNFISLFKKLGTPTATYHPEIYKWKNFKKGLPVYKRIGFTSLESKYPDITKILYLMFDYNQYNRISSEDALKMFQVIKF
jgi:hypothetical protein